MPISSEDLQIAGKTSLDDFLRNRPVDQIAVDVPLFRKLMSKRKPFLGAKQNIVAQIRKSHDSNFAWAYGEEPVAFNKRNTIEQAAFPWRRAVDGRRLLFTLAWRCLNGGEFVALCIFVAVEDTDVLGQEQRGFDIVAQVGDSTLFQWRLSGFPESFDVGDGVVVGQEMVSGRDMYQCGIAVDFQWGVPVATGGEFFEFGTDFHRIWRCVEVSNEIDDIVNVMKDDDAYDAA